MKKCFVELLGSFLLAMAITLTGNPLAIGLMLTACILFGGHISGGHYNPIVSLALFAHRRISFETLLKYVAAQIGGTFLALALFRVIANVAFVPDITSGLSLPVLFGIEALLTFLFCLVVLTIHEKRAASGFDPHSAILIGLSLMSIAFIGGLFNPAIALSSLGHQLLADGISTSGIQIVVQLIAPCAASLCTSYIYRFINN